MSETPPIVDPSPAAAPIMANTETLEDFLAAHPAEASPQDVLDLKPNTYEDATEGPHEQISQTAYVTMTKPDGTSFIAPKANVEHYESKGYTAGAEQDIPDFVAYLEERAMEDPKPPTPPDPEPQPDPAPPLPTP